MKNLKRITAFLCAAVMLFSACGQKETEVSTDAFLSTETSVSTSASIEENTQKQDEPAVTEYKKVNFDTSVAYQTIEGFGAAYTWYGDRLLNAKNPEKGLDALFKDAKLTILRFKNEYEYSVPGKASNAVAMARNYKEARDRAAEYGENIMSLLCCWSPPAKLKSDETISTGYGTLKKNEAGEYMYKEYADWWVESVKYYESRGLNIDFVSIQNEVDFSPASYEGCRFGTRETETEASYAKAYIAVYEAFKEAFGDEAPILLAPETMGCNITSLLGYTRDIIDYNPEALGGLAFHLYASGNNSEAENSVKATSYLTEFDSMKQYFPNTRKWQTEFFIGHGIQTAELVWYALTTANLNAYLYWSGVWADSTPDKFESADLVEIDNSGNWRLSANYYAMRHFSEFIRPGYIRVESKGDGTPVKNCTFVNENKSKVAMVLINSTDNEQIIQLNGNDYTIKEAYAYQSVFGDVATSDKDMYKALGKLSEDAVIVLPAKSVTTVDITGYEGNTPVDVPAVNKIVYENDINTDISGEPVPSTDKVMVDTSFTSDADLTPFRGFGSSIVKRVEDGGKDNNGCMVVKMRQDAWNGATLASEFFDHYGYLAKIEYDCMINTDGATVSCTSTFTIDNSTYYPDGEKNRAVCHNMKAGKWYHVEGYVTMYDNMKPGSFSIYWESPDNTEDIYLDNVKLTILYTEKAGSYK